MNYDDEDDEQATRQERREARRQPHMKVNGKSVFRLQELGGRPKKEKRWTRPREA